MSHTLATTRMLHPENRSDGKRVCVAFLHGILGNKNNWLSFAQRLKQKLPGVDVVLVDLRGHGASHSFAPPHTIDACAADVLRLNADVVVGHSFGGKVALAASIARDAVRHPSDVVVLDAPPGKRVFFEGNEEIDAVLRAVRSVPLPVASRKALVEHLLAQGLAMPLCQWMTTNLRAVDPDHHEAGFVFSFDLDVVAPLLRSFADADLWPLIEHAGSTRVHMIRAGRGLRFSAGDVERLAAAHARGSLATDAVMPQAGHWLHTDDPEGLLALLCPIILRAQEEQDGVSA